MISNRCARKSLVTNCNSIISKNYLRFLVDSNVAKYKIRIKHFGLYTSSFLQFQRQYDIFLDIFSGFDFTQQQIQQRFRQKIY